MQQLDWSLTSRTSPTLLRSFTGYRWPPASASKHWNWRTVLRTDLVQSTSRTWDKMTCWILRLFILFILTSCVCAGSFVVNVTQSSYQAEEDHSITLEWSFTTTGLTPNVLNVFCQLLTVDRRYFLFHVHEGVEVPESQDEHFAGRVQWDKDVLREGRVRLHVSRLRTDDSGLYVCRVIARSGTSSGECHLNVSAARDRPEPETTSSPAESPPQPERRGWIVLGCVVGLMGVALLLIIMIIKYTVKRRKLTAAVVVSKKQVIMTDRSLSEGLYLTSHHSTDPRPHQTRDFLGVFVLMRFQESGNK